jgi:hypothetical protein
VDSFTPTPFRVPQAKQHKFWYAFRVGTSLKPENTHADDYDRAKRNVKARINRDAGRHPMVPLDMTLIGSNDPACAKQIGKRVA